RTPAGLALEPDVGPGGEPVPGHAHRQVGRDDDQPDHRRQDLDDRDREDGVLEAALTQAAEEAVADESADGEVRAGELLGLLADELAEAVLRATDEQDRRALEEHHELDEVGLPEVRAEEAALAALGPRVVLLAVDDQEDDADRAEHAQALGDPLVAEPVADDRQREVGLEEL